MIENYDVDIEIPKNDWDKLMSNTYFNGKGRQSFLVTMDNYLSRKLQEMGHKCLLRSNYNWFQKENSLKDSSNYWYGKYHCKNDNCAIIFEAFIQSKPCANTKVIIKVCWFGIPNHDIVPIPIRCCGDERNEVGSAIARKTTQRVCHENRILNAICDEKSKPFKS